VSALSTDLRVNLATTDGQTPDDLWHLPADETHDRRAASGLSWLTLCGQMRPPARESKTPYLETPDDCIVCARLEVAS
jgi:hypothetical protein